MDILMGLLGNTPIYYIVTVNILFIVGVYKLYEFISSKLVSKSEFTEEIERLKKEDIEIKELMESKHEETQTLFRGLQQQITEGVKKITNVIHSLEKSTLKEIGEINTRVSVLEERSKIKNSD